MKKMKILMVSSECYPFAKTGGLGDVVGALPKALAEAGAEVRVMLPKYGSIPKAYSEDFKLLDVFYVRVGGQEQYVGIQSYKMEDVTYYFLDNEYYFKRPELYGYYDDGERFVYFARGVLESIPYIGFYPDIIHCNDWQTALIPYLLKEQYAQHYTGAHSLFTIHNIRYQGHYGNHDLDHLIGLDQLPEALEYYGGINLMKGALCSADLITTVSPNYAKEIKTPAYGEGLEGVIQFHENKVKGILNGIDTKVYDPASDPTLICNYHTETNLKIQNKTALQKELKLTVDAHKPLIAMVSRLVEQKGLDLMAAIIHELMQEDIQLVILGTGDSKYETLLKETEETYPEKMRGLIAFDESLSRRIYAAADLFLIPSKFEPCGLTQMIAMRYGAIPLVRATGGLKDSVQNFDAATGKGNGFVFENYNANELLTTIQSALALYRENQPAWQRLIQNAFDTDFSWQQSAQFYMQCYENILSR